VNKVLAPVRHRDSYTQAVERIVKRYFDETIFDPLFGILEAARVPDVRQNAAADWQPFPSELRSLGIPRKNMPQIAGEDRAGLLSFLKTLGVKHDRATIRASALRPSQREFSREKIEAARLHASTARPVLVSKDGYVVDGHHQWFSELLDDPDAEVYTLRFDEMARPLIAHVRMYREAYRENSRDSELERALESGRVWYADGVFAGTFTARIAAELRRLGATFDAGQRVFRLPVERLPADIKTAAVASLDRSKAAHQQLQKFLNEAEQNFAGAATGIDVDLAVKRITDDLQTQFLGTVKGLDWIEVGPDITPGMREALTKQLTTNLDLDVKNFLATEIPDLRRVVEENAFAGYRADRLAKVIQARYGVTKRKAAFLADQETGLLVSKYREEQAKSIGAVAYKWSTSHDERVRPDHRALNGRIFFFSDPPITNTRTGARNNPGEDFRCRCVAMPVISIPGNLNLHDVANCKRAEFRCARSA
jgi:SPP1 gp7 family putative phage head morphogenesis protein